MRNNPEDQFFVMGMGMLCSIFMVSYGFLYISTNVLYSRLSSSVHGLSASLRCGKARRWQRMPGYFSLSVGKGQYSGQKSLFLPQPKKSGKAISSLFFAVFSVPQHAKQRDFSKKNGYKTEENGAQHQNF